MLLCRPATIVLSLLLLVPPIALCAGTDSGTADITEWSLDELMSYKISRLDVMGAHTHRQGEFMVAYQFMTMSMEGNVDGSESVALSTVFDGGFMVAPTSMTMQMHMIDIMYAYSDRLTFMAMIPYYQISMDHQTSPMTGSNEFTANSEGFGDVSLTALVTVYEHESHRLLLNPSVNFPTGSVEQKDFLANPAMGKATLAYPMQLGSGTYDVVPAITYIGEFANWDLGLKAAGTFRLGENSSQYTLGDRTLVQAWTGYRVADWFSPSLTLKSQKWSDISGGDPTLNPAMVPTADPSLNSGSRTDLLLGMNFLVLDGAFKNQRFIFEGGLPVYQSLDGPALATEWQFTFRLARTFE